MQYNTYELNKDFNYTFKLEKNNSFLNDDFND